jgi:hypothetical protein
MYSELERMWKERNLGWVEALSWNLTGGTEESYENFKITVSGTRPFEVPYTEQELFSLRRDCGLNDMNVPKLHCSSQYSDGLGLKCRPAGLRRNRSSWFVLFFSRQLLSKIMIASFFIGLLCLSFDKVSLYKKKIFYSQTSVRSWKTSRL